MFAAMTRAEIWLQDTLDKALNIDELASYLGYSPSQIRRTFRQCFQMSPSEYREKRRLERAAVLLSLTPQNIAQIAAQCGYQNHSSFSRAFQRRYQLTPRDYRYASAQCVPAAPPQRHFATTVKKSQTRQAVFMRLYQGAEEASCLFGRQPPPDSLQRLKTQLTPSTPTIALPDLLSEHIAALIDEETRRLKRTDIGLHVESQRKTKQLALPAAYRRVAIPAHYYASTPLNDVSELSQAVTATLSALTTQTKPLHVSGQTPCVLWHAQHLELQVPLSV